MKLPVIASPLLEQLTFMITKLPRFLQTFSRIILPRRLLQKRERESLPIVEQSLPASMRKQYQRTKLRRHATDLG